MAEIVGFSADLLSGWYSAQTRLATTRAAASAAAAGQGQASAAAQKDAGVIPPWDYRAQPEGLDVLSRSVLADGVFFEDREFKSIEASDDAKGLFSLHQGLKRLYALASEAADGSSTEVRRAFLERRFQEGMAQFETFLSGLDLEGVSLARGASRTVAESAARIARGVSEYVTPIVHQGDFDAPVEAFAGDVTFTVSITKNGIATPVSIDLADMGATPRTLDNVAGHINAKLEAAGFYTHFKRVKIGEKDENGIVPGSDFGFKISGVSTEKVTFSAAGGPSLYLAGVSGTGETAAGQLTKLNGLADAAPEAGFIRRMEADAAVTLDDDGEEVSAPGSLTAQATALGPGGELYVLGQTRAGVDGAALKGDSDLVLMKYDSTGRRVWSRVLGAAEAASGADLAVAADGSVVVTGRVDGGLGDTVDKGGADGFVARYSAAGAEQWLQRFGTGADDAPSSIALGPGGEIYVGGWTKGTLGAAAQGGRDGFVRAFDADGAAQWTRQVGGPEADSVRALAIADDGGLLVASVEDGAGRLTKYSAADGVSGPVWSHDLGGLDYGDLAAVAVDGGDIYLTGSAGAGSALAGAHAGHAGARDAFLMRLTDSGAAAAEDYVAFLGTGSYDAATDIAVAGGAVYLAGRTDGALPGGGELTGDRNSFAARLAAADGALGWTRQVSGHGGLSEAFSLALDPAGDSALDALGLPRGALDYGGGDRLTERTALRAGDHFFVSVDGGRKKKIAIEADETYLSLSFKINAALVLDGKARVARSSEGAYLQIRPAGDAVIELFPAGGATGSQYSEAVRDILGEGGGQGRDALKALGLEAGAVRNRPDPDEEGVSAAPPLYALDMPAALSIAGKGGAEAAVEALDKAMTTIRTAYRKMNEDPALTELLNRKKASGPPPAYLTAQLANFQAGLNRLNAGADPNAAFLV